MSFSIFDTCNSMDEVLKAIAELEPQKQSDLGIESLQIFIARNWCGLIECPDLPSFMHATAFVELSFDLNTLFNKTRSPEFLLIAKRIFVDAKSNTDYLWQLKTLCAWQRCILEPHHKLKGRIQQLLKLVDEISGDQKPEFLLTAFQSLSGYYEFEIAQDLLAKADLELGIDTGLTGKMGKRTFWQQRSLAQLVVQTHIKNKETDVKPCADLPTNVRLNDDTLLENVQFEDAEKDSVPLSALQLCLLIAHGMDKLVGNSQDEIAVEECSAFVEGVIAQRRDWAVQASALLFRSSLECSKRRKVERACGQMEDLVKAMNGNDKTPKDVVMRRVKYVLATKFSPWWECRSLYADILSSLGCVSEAILTFEALEKWAKVIECYKTLKKLDIAEALIRSLLDKQGDDPELLTLLGEITQEGKYFEQAIKVSKDRSARARKAYGMLQLERKEYLHAYENFQHSLMLQPIQLGVWYNAGHCAWQMKRWTDAAVCYRRCVHLEPDHYEAWNNLSASCLNLGQGEQAKKQLYEALKLNFENPRVWLNYALICVTTKDLIGAMRSVHKVLDLHHVFDHNSIMSQLGKLFFETAETEPRTETDDDNLDDLIKLFGRIASKTSLSAKNWFFYALLKKPRTGSRMEFEKYIYLLEKSLNAAKIEHQEWYANEEQTVFVLTTAVHLAEARDHLANIINTENAKLQAATKTKLSTRLLNSELQKHFNGNIPEYASEQLIKLLNHTI